MVRFEPPRVDMTGVDPVRYNNDLGACTSEKIQANSTSVWTHGIISACMERKGCRVLAANGLPASDSP